MISTFLLYKVVSEYDFVGVTFTVISQHDFDSFITVVSEHDFDSLILTVIG